MTLDNLEAISICVPKVVARLVANLDALDCFHNLYSVEEMLYLDALSRVGLVVVKETIS